MKRLLWIAMVGVVWMLGSALWKIYVLSDAMSGDEFTGC
jgi:hypothetical protein